VTCWHYVKSKEGETRVLTYLLSPKTCPPCGNELLRTINWILQLQNRQRHLWFSKFHTLAVGRKLPAPRGWRRCCSSSAANVYKIREKVHAPDKLQKRHFCSYQSVFTCYADNIRRYCTPFKPLLRQNIIRQYRSWLSSVLPYL